MIKVCLEYFHKVALNKQIIQASYANVYINNNNNSLLSVVVRVSIVLKRTVVVGND